MNSSSETRRALVKHYKDTVRPAGVYLVHNTKNDRVYVAGSLDVAGAVNRMRFELKLGSHRNKALQQDWLAHGATHFEFKEIDRVKESEDPAFDRAAELEKLVALWVEEYGCHGERGYNVPTRRDRALALRG